MLSPLKRPLRWISASPFRLSVPHSKGRIVQVTAPEPAGKLGGKVAPIGRIALLLLFLLSPSFNPPLYQAGDERLYFAMALLLIAAATAIPQASRAWWVRSAAVLATLYVVEVGLGRGDYRLGLLGNAYRPIQPVVAYVACCFVIGDSRRDRYLNYFLMGGLVGTSLGILHTLVPAFDPFALSRPNLGWISQYGGVLKREAGAFAYPNNFGMYSAYVAIIGLSALARGREQIRNSLAFAASLTGLLAVLVSGSRSALLGLSVAALLVLWRSPRLRVPVIALSAVTLCVFLVSLALTGFSGVVLRDRIGGISGSLSIRTKAWHQSWDVFVRSPVFGGGLVSNTIDSTFFYLLEVGGALAIALIVALYWTSILRPLRQRRDGTGAILALALASSLLQDSFGQPLVNWVIGAGVFLVATPPRTQRHVVTDDVQAPRSRRSLSLLHAARATRLHRRKVP
jgi:hypothetical protein